MKRLNEPTIIKESSRGYDTLQIAGELLLSRELFLTEGVDRESMEGLIKQLMWLYREDPDKEITLYINSPGGEITSGLCVFDFLKLIKAPIKTVCIGCAASMGAILFLAGDKRLMMPNASVMIHDPAPSGGSMAGMKPAEMEEHLKELRKAQKTLVDIIAEKTGKSQKEIRRYTEKDSFFNAEEAVSFGLATDIIQEL